MKISTKTRTLVVNRSSNRCEICGTGGTLHDHHRRPRAMGGASDWMSDSPANMLRIHYRCHEKVESKRQWAIDLGYIVAQGLDPSRIPVRLFDGWYLLGHRGEAVPVKEPVR